MSGSSAAFISSLEKVFGNFSVPLAREPALRACLPDLGCSGGAAGTGGWLSLAPARSFASGAGAFVLAAWPGAGRRLWASVRRFGASAHGLLLRGTVYGRCRFQGLRLQICRSVGQGVPVPPATNRGIGSTAMKPSALPIRIAFSNLNGLCGGVVLPSEGNIYLSRQEFRWQLFVSNLCFRSGAMKTEQPVLHTTAPIGSPGDLNAARRSGPSPRPAGRSELCNASLLFSA